MDPAMIERFERLLDQQRNASKAYYARNYKITDDMTEEQKQAIQVKIEARNLKLKERYVNNKEYFKDSKSYWS
jgi:hypothetical protein